MSPADRRIDRGHPKSKSILEPIGLLMPHLQHGKVYSFWEDELRLDLAQEAALAIVEGRDPIEAMNAYRLRELYWRAITCPLIG